MLASSGFVRLKQGADPDPPIPFGASMVLGPAYWSTENQSPVLHFNPQITTARIRTDSLQSNGDGALRIDFEGCLGDLDMCYRLRLPRPRDSLSTLFIDAKFRALQPITLSARHQQEHQAFRLAQFSSMYIDERLHDSDAASFTNLKGERIQIAFKDVPPGQFLFRRPQAMKPGTPLSLLHTDDFGYQGNTPNFGLWLLESSLPGENVPQGFLTPSTDPNQDNLGLWINQENLPLQISAGDSGEMFFKLIAVDNPENGSVTRVETRDPPGNKILLAQNYPNPFNPVTVIQYYLPRAMHIDLKVYDLAGRELATLVDREMPPGWHRQMLSTRGWANGIYFYRLQAAGFRQSRKFLLLR
ncbi:MAG: T9SS C-terminal target domain-containing protein [Calditrichaeota bacterium]|nr:MAG: T9SS C-terminal target domain-containing protein [Calditrichota bacterium]